jgi:hypothetical protein
MYDRRYNPDDDNTPSSGLFDDQRASLRPDDPHPYSRLEK